MIEIQRRRVAEIRMEGDTEYLFYEGWQIHKGWGGIFHAYSYELVIGISSYGTIRYRRAKGGNHYTHPRYTKKWLPIASELVEVLKEEGWIE